MQPLKSLNPIPTIPSLMAELMKGLQHEDDERLCAFIEVVKIPENIHEARIGSKPQDGWEDLGSHQTSDWAKNADWIVTNICNRRSRRD